LVVGFVVVAFPVGRDVVVAFAPCAVVEPSFEQEAMSMPVAATQANNAA
jgi:hypothetical protein